MQKLLEAEFACSSRVCVGSPGSSHSPKMFRRIGSSTLTRGGTVSVNRRLSLCVSPAVSWRCVQGA